MTRCNQQYPHPCHWLLLSLFCLVVSMPLARAETPLPTYNYADEEEYYCPEDYPIDVQNNDVETDIEEATRKAAEELVGPSAFDFLDPHQEYISDYLRRYTTGMDQFFANTEKSDQYTGSFIRITLDTTWNEAGDIEFDPGIKFRLRLPQTQRKLKLIIESDPDEKRTVQDLETRGAETDPESEDNKGVYTGVETEVGKSQKWKFRPSLGLRLRSPIDYYLRFRANRDKYFENWKLYFRETIYWFDSTGFGADTSMDWDRLLTPNLLFRSSSFLRYTDERDQWDMSQSLNLIQQLSPKRSVIYKFAVFADTEPAMFATSYLLNLRYRQNVHKDYMFVELQPQILFEKETDFESQYSLFLRLELLYRG